MPSALAWITSRPVVVLSAFALFYAGLGLSVLAPEAVYSGDIGVKYVQARALGLHRFASMDIPYPGTFLDPDGEFLPMRPPFIMFTAGTTQAIFSPLSAVFQAVVVGLAGIRGLIMLSIVGAVGTLWAASVLIPADGKAALLVALGIGSPLWFYGVSGWEHAPAVALGTAAFALSVRARDVRAAATAGALLGAGAVLRDEVLLLLPGMLLALWWQTRTVRTIADGAWCDAGAARLCGSRRGTLVSAPCGGASATRRAPRSASGASDGCGQPRCPCARAIDDARSVRNGHSILASGLRE